MKIKKNAKNKIKQDLLVDTVSALRLSPVYIDGRSKPISLIIPVNLAYLFVSLAKAVNRVLSI